jgi:Glycogen recognition site of AMP-activated protein kinase
MTDDPRDGEEARVTERIRAAYERTPAVDAAARERLDRRLEGLPAPRRGLRGLGWSLGSGHSSARPIWAMALALVVVVGLAVTLRPRGEHPAALPLPPPPYQPPVISTAPIDVRFGLIAPRASRVAVVGDFNSWDAAATPMRREAEDLWITDVALPPGAHDYAFVVDGRRWVTDPTAPLSPLHEFGPRNSVVIVGGSSPS